MRATGITAAGLPADRGSPGGLATGSARPPNVQAGASGGSALDEEKATLVTELGDPAITALTSPGRWTPRSSAASLPRENPHATRGREPVPPPAGAAPGVAPGVAV